jgi:uncharacterized protein (TIGR00251 family)
VSEAVPGSNASQDPILREHPEGCTLAVRVQPGAKRTAITGLYGQNSRLHLNIALQAPPIEGRANDALIAFLGKLLSIPRMRIRIIYGERDRFKLVLFEGVKVSAAQAAIEAALKTRS